MVMQISLVRYHGIYVKFWAQTDSLLSVLTEEAWRYLKHCVFYGQDFGEVPGRKQKIR